MNLAEFPLEQDYKVCVASFFFLSSGEGSSGSQLPWKQHFKKVICTSSEDLTLSEGHMKGYQSKNLKVLKLRKLLVMAWAKASEEPSFLYSLFFMSSMSESLQISFVVALWIPKHNLDASHIRTQDFALWILCGSFAPGQNRWGSCQTRVCGWWMMLDVCGGEEEESDLLACSIYVCWTKKAVKNLGAHLGQFVEWADE